MADVSTFTVHVSVDATSKERAETLVGDCLRAGGLSDCIKSEEDEYAVVLEGQTDLMEGC